MIASVMSLQTQEKMRILSHLSACERTVCKMRANGASTVTIAAVTGSNRESVRQLLQRPDIREYLKHCIVANTSRDAANTESILVAKLMQMLERVRQSAT